MDKAKAGQRHIPAKDWNEIRDFINNFFLQNGGMVNNPYNPFLITVKNSVSGVDLEPFQVVRVNSAMYPSRSADDTVTAALNGSIELDASAPTGEDGENIAIVQYDIANGDIGSAICSGATLCYVNIANAQTDYKFAKSKAGETDYLEASEDGGQARIIWKQPGTGKKLAYVILDQTGTPTPEYFVINKNWNGSGTPPNTPSIFTAGSLHYVRWDGSDWIPHNDNEAVNSTSPKRPSGAKLVVCQTDAPTDAKNFRMPYFTPEDNLGVPPDFSDSVSVIDAGERCGVIPGEHEFTGKCYDYRKIEGSYIYEPAFTATVQAMGQTGGNNQLYIDINNEQYECYVPIYNPTLADNSGPSYPDIWPYDYIVVSFDCETYTAQGLNYPRDYPEGTIMPWYRPSPWSNPTYPGRGWQQYIPSGGQGEITVVQIDKNSAHYDAAGDCVWVEAGANDKIPVKEGSLCFVEKIKTNAIV